MQINSITDNNENKKFKEKAWIEQKKTFLKIRILIKKTQNFLSISNRKKK